MKQLLTKLLLLLNLKKDKGMKFKNVKFDSFKIANFYCQFYFGELVDKEKYTISENEMFFWLLEQSKLNNTKAIYQLAKCYEFGSLFKYRSDKAGVIQVENDVNITQFMDSFNWVISIPPNIETAILLHELAGSLGNGESFYQLGLINEHGIMKQVNKEGAKMYFKKGADLNNVESLYSSGVKEFELENYTAAYDYFLRAADLGHLNSCINVAIALNRDDFVFEKNNEMAFYYAKVAYDQNQNDLEVKNLMDKINYELSNES